MTHYLAVTALLPTLERMPSLLVQTSTLLMAFIHLVLWDTALMEGLTIRCITLLIVNACHCIRYTRVCEQIHKLGGVQPVFVQGWVHKECKGQSSHLMTFEYDNKDSYSRATIYTFLQSVTQFIAVQLLHAQEVVTSAIIHFHSARCLACR